jgi:hypothetical protein
MNGRDNLKDGSKEKEDFRTTVGKVSPEMLPQGFVLCAPPRQNIGRTNATPHLYIDVCDDKRLTSLGI